MTYKQFLVALEKTPRDWRVCLDGKIRRGFRQCPISSLEGCQEENWRWVAANQKISPTNIGNILRAADFNEHRISRFSGSKWTAKRVKHCIEMRRDLLKACGLAAEKEEK